MRQLLNTTAKVKLDAEKTASKNQSIKQMMQYNI